MKALSSVGRKVYAFVGAFLGACLKIHDSVFGLIHLVVTALMFFPLIAVVCTAHLLEHELYVPRQDIGQPVPGEESNTSFALAGLGKGSVRESCSRV